ncbi:NPR2 protein [Capsaspora owczarzaki ATCC 30864]|uniref:Guanylate cyclase n=1 Tax=Capsaspora owczarzaki (strain ATCC 30864) TaxID=595528 RepID=A0A0D2U867_CAPO3|nr:NPR2 protein [Capsaspora owczarzaki ATCC 30864]KJE91301.1 RGC/RGC protein kinase [Capsaspora owczarzaki ATCC 30864]|eukprot:XP_004349207.1 NPR2 protein [Capsaspora owczarzaki ATCC 30864]
MRNQRSVARLLLLLLLWLVATTAVLAADAHSDRARPPGRRAGPSADHSSNSKWAALAKAAQAWTEQATAPPSERAIEHVLAYLELTSAGAVPDNEHQQQQEGDAVTPEALARVVDRRRRRQERGESDPTALSSAWLRAVTNRAVRSDEELSGREQLLQRKKLRRQQQMGAGQPRTRTRTRSSRRSSAERREGEAAASDSSSSSAYLLPPVLRVLWHDSPSCSEFRNLVAAFDADIAAVEIDCLPYSTWFDILYSNQSASASILDYDLVMFNEMWLPYAVNSSLVTRWTPVASNPSSDWVNSGTTAFFSYPQTSQNAYGYPLEGDVQTIMFRLTPMIEGARVAAQLNDTKTNDLFYVQQTADVCPVELVYLGLCKTHIYRPPLSLQQLVKQAEFLQQHNITQFGFSASWCTQHNGDSLSTCQDRSFSLFLTYAYLASGALWNPTTYEVEGYINSPVNVAALELIKQLVATGPTDDAFVGLQSPPDATNEIERNIELFCSGKVAFLQLWSSSIPHVNSTDSSIVGGPQWQKCFTNNNDLGVFAIPAFQQSTLAGTELPQRRNLMGGYGIAVVNGSPYVAEASALVNYISRWENQAFWSQSCSGLSVSSTLLQLGQNLEDAISVLLDLLCVNNSTSSSSSSSSSSVPTSTAASFASPVSATASPPDCTADLTWVVAIIVLLQLSSNDMLTNVYSLAYPFASGTWGLKEAPALIDMTNRYVTRALFGDMSSKAALDKLATAQQALIDAAYPNIRNPAAGEEDVLSPGAIAGLIVMAIVIVALVGLTVWRQRQYKRQKELEALQQWQIDFNALTDIEVVDNVPHTARFEHKLVYLIRYTPLTMAVVRRSSPHTIGSPNGGNNAGNDGSASNGSSGSEEFAMEELSSGGGGGSQFPPNGKNALFRRSTAAKISSAMQASTQRLRQRARWVAQPSANPEVEEASLLNRLAPDFVKLRELRHPNVVEFHGCTRVPPTPRYLVFDYCAKGSLADVLRFSSIPLDIHFKFCMAMDAARGLAFLHERGIAHGRLRSSKILVDDRFVCKISGFGLHSIMGESRADMLFSGNPANHQPTVASLPTERSSSPSGSLAIDLIGPDATNGASASSPTTPRSSNGIAAALGRAHKALSAPAIPVSHSPPGSPQHQQQTQQQQQQQQQGTPTHPSSLLAVPAGPPVMLRSPSPNPAAFAMSASASSVPPVGGPSLPNGYLGGTVHGAPFLWVAPEILALDMPDDDDEDDVARPSDTRSNASERSYLELDLHTIDWFKADMYSFGIILWELLDGHHIPYSHLPELTSDQLRRRIVAGAAVHPTTSLRGSVAGTSSFGHTASARQSTGSVSEPRLRSQSVHLDSESRHRAQSAHQDSESRVRSQSFHLDSEDDSVEDTGDAPPREARSHIAHQSDSSLPGLGRGPDRSGQASRGHSPSHQSLSAIADNFSTTSGRGNFYGTTTTFGSQFSLRHRILVRPDLEVVSRSDDPQLHSMAAIARRCWEPEPANRFDQFNEVVRELEAMGRIAGQSLLERMAFMLEKYSTHLEDIVEERTLELEDEKRRAESLLYNILPISVAKRLQEDVNFIGDLHPEATVFFSDIVGFSAMSHSASPADVVSMLNQLFTMMDKLADEHKLEKIKTIGDAYMACCGCPTYYPNHVQRVALFALNVQRMEIMGINGTPLQMRIGIHTGPVIAGVVGTRKFAYDLWGDTVNTASRMESNGEPGKICVSEATYHILKDSFEFQVRESRYIKGIGDCVTYFLLGVKGKKVFGPRPPTSKWAQLASSDLRRRLIATGGVKGALLRMQSFGGSHGSAQPLPSADGGHTNNNNNNNNKTQSPPSSSPGSPKASVSSGAAGEGAFALHASSPSAKPDELRRRAVRRRIMAAVTATGRLRAPRPLSLLGSQSSRDLFSEPLCLSGSDESEAFDENEGYAELPPRRKTVGDVAAGHVSFGSRLAVHEASPVADASVAEHGSAADHVQLSFPDVVIQVMESNRRQGGDPSNLSAFTEISGFGRRKSLQMLQAEQEQLRHAPLLVHVPEGGDSESAV